MLSTRSFILSLGAFTELPGTGSLYTHCTLCSQHSPPSVSSACSFLLFLQTSLGHYFLSGAGTFLLRFRGPFPTYPMSLGSTTLPSTPGMSPDTRWVLNEYLFNEYITDKRKCPYRHSIHFPLLNRPNATDHQALFSDCHFLVSVLLSCLDHCLNCLTSPRVSLLLDPISLQVESFCDSLLAQINIQHPWRAAKALSIALLRPPLRLSSKTLGSSSACPTSASV